MAIVDMQHLSILLMKRDEEALLALLQRAGCVQFVDHSVQDQAQATSDGHRERVEEQLGRIKWAINRLMKYSTQKQSMFTPLPLAQRSAIESEDLSDILPVIEQLEHLEKQAGELRGHQTRLAQTEEQLRPWLALDASMDELASTSSTRTWTGQAPNRGFLQLVETWQGRPVIISQLSQQRDTVYFYAVAHQSVVEDFLSSLRAIGFQPAAPLSGSLTPKQQLDKVEQEAQSLQGKNEHIQREIEQLSSHVPALKLAYESLSAAQSRQEAKQLITQSQSTALMSGWVPKHIAPALVEEIQKQFPSAQTALRDPQEGEEPPVLLRNNAITRPYEAVVSGFTLPAPGALDPTSMMMPFFACFFGMMVSDAGYGLVMALLIPILIKVMQPSEGGRKIFWIIGGGGLATVLWGALYNTWFGFGPWPSLLDPVNDSLPVMAVCIGIGALHLFTGLGMGAYQNIKKGDFKSAVYDQVSWALLVVGLGLLALPQTAEIGKWMAIIGAVIVTLFAGRDKSKNPIKRVISGLGALYGVTGWISDLLSYMRLFGMGLATGVIGMVINQLVGMIMGGGIIGIIIGSVVFVGAHLFNAAINILGAYVHACRLQYIEFFGKFFEEGGKPFKPLRFAPRYVRIHE